MREVGAYEAKTHLPRLLDEVAAGEPVTITKHGVAVAVLVPATAPSEETVRAAISGLRAFRTGHRLAGVAVRELIDEGRV
jgi:prevent-host-death family protein